MLVYSGVRPTISPATNTATIGKDQHPVQARPDPAVHHLAKLDQHHRRESAQRWRERPCIELTEPFDAAVVAVAHNAELVMPKRVSLLSMLPPLCVALATMSTPGRGHARIAALFSCYAQCKETDENDGHCRKQRASLAGIRHHPAEREAQRGRDQQDGQFLQEVGQRRRVLRTGGAEFDAEKAASIGAQSCLTAIWLAAGPIGSVCSLATAFSVTGLPAASSFGVPSALFTGLS